MKEERTLPPAIFLGGALALDFLNSIATPVDEIIEWMGNGVDFLSWMKQAGFKETRVEHLVGPDSMVVGIK